MHAVLNNIIVRDPEVTEKKTETGIVLQNNVNRNSIIEVEVINVGPKIENIKEGDLILIKAYSGDTFNYNDISYRLLSENEVLAVL